MLKKMKIWQKLALIAVFMGVPIPIVTYLLYAEKSKARDFAQKEVYGVHYIRLTAPLLRDVQKHRVLNSIYARGNQSVLEEMNKQKQLIDQDIRVLEELEQQPISKSLFSKLFGGDATYGATLRSAEQLRIVKDKWETIKRQSPSFTPAQSFDAHSAVCQNIIDLTAHVGDTSNLILDPDLDTYYLMDAVVINVPKAMENLGAMKTMTVGIASANSKTLDEEKMLSLLSGRATENISNLKTGVQKAVAYNPSIQQEIAPPMEKAAGSAELFLSTTDKTIVRVDKVEMLAGTKDILSSAESNGDDFFKYNVVALNQLENLLHLRISGIWWSQMFVFTMVLGGLLFTALLVWFIVRSITQPLNHAVGVAKGLARGDLKARIETDATDETGQLLLAMNEMIAYLNEMADVSDKIAGGYLKVDVRTRSAEDRFGNSFKNMLDNTLKLVQSQDERNEMQNSIMKLLNEVADVASGDLTAEAEVTPDMTGAIADAFNYMILELRNVINKVKETTLQVSSSAAEIQATTEHLAEGSEMQSKQINDTSMAIEEMAASIHQVSENAAMSASVADKSLLTARQGTNAVQNNIQAMSRIREQVQETSKRIKRLGERSQEIGEIVKLIDDIADRTSMLALNASIQAAMAGEAGRGFAVVAEEVERLADRSTNATKQITALTKSIQSETNEVVMAMEDTTREVVEGSTLANEAGKALNEIQSVSQQLAELIQSISQASKQQARGSEALAKSMSGISEVTNQVASGTKQAAVSVRSMVVLADELRGSVVTFKLPESNGNGNGNGHAYN